MERVPLYVRELMGEIPVAWDETRFVDGYPGRWVVLARRTGDTWYVAGINGTGEPLEADLGLPFLMGNEATMVTDGEEARSFRRETARLTEAGVLSVLMKTNGGFLMKSGG
jgi:hypothetical protein